MDEASEEAEEVVTTVEVVVEVRAPQHRLLRHLPDPEMQLKGGQTSNVMLTHLLSAVVKNIINLGKVHTGVKSQEPVHGKTSLSRKIINEILTSLRH